MKNLHPEIIGEILNYLGDVCFKINFLTSCKQGFSLKYLITRQIKDKKKIINNNFPKLIQDLFLHQLLFYPRLSWKNTFLGPTGYIDQIRITDLTHPIMFGVDEYSRSFIVILHKDVEEQQYYSLDVLFQRYTSEKSTWSNSHVGDFSIIQYSGYFYNRGVLRDKYLSENLKCLIKNKGYVTASPMHIDGEFKERKTHRELYNLSLYFN